MIEFESAVVELDITGDEEVPFKGFCSVLIMGSADGGTELDRAVSVTGPKRTVLREGGLLKTATLFLEPEGFCRKDILCTWP